jgi:hypothetical protein
MIQAGPSAPVPFYRQLFVFGALVAVEARTPSVDLKASALTELLHLQQPLKALRALLGVLRPRVFPVSSFLLSHG